ncbi:Sialidase precursor [compost metagenome]
MSESVYTEIVNLNLPAPAEDLTSKTDDPNWENKWLVIGYTNQETASENGRAANLVDGNAATYWHSRWSSTPGTYPYFIAVDMKKDTTVTGFTFTQRNGVRRVKDVEIQVSQDNVNWNSEGQFVLQDIITPQNVALPAVKSFRYFKLIFKSGFDGTQNAAMAEIKVY